MKVGFTGTRQGFTEPQSNAFANLMRNAESVSEFQHGSCKGADIQAAYRLPRRIKRVAHPGTDANGENPHYARDEKATILEPKPYLVRNHDIVDATQVLIACPAGMKEELRSGTWATVRYARKQGKAITIIYPDGRIEIR